MTTSVFVVSDLHLGGKPGFRMCEEGVERLGKLFEHIATQIGKTAHTEIVIAGDIVDFLAVEDSAGETWSAFTRDEDEALTKLEEILGDTAIVWDKLAACLRRGVTLTLMLGNHDIELSFPKLRRRLVERLAGGNIEFLYDNQAYTRGKLLVEHGNRYEGWNVVDHDGLRRVRSLMSRGQKAGEFGTQPGSELVARIMNKLKKRFAWIDLLKPETSGLLPLIALLASGLWRDVGRGIATGARAAWRDRQYGGDRMPTTDGFIGGEDPSVSAESVSDEDRDMFEQAERFAADGGDSTIAGAIDELKEDLLFEALCAWGEKDGRTFAIENEAERYREAAAELARAGYEVVVFGHTHHVKRISLPYPAGAIYLNTGTWADLMRIPESTLTGDKAARAEFAAFVEQLRTNNVANIRRLIATFARIDIDDRGEIASQNVYFFDPDGSTPVVTTEGVLDRLRARP